MEKSKQRNTAWIGIVVRLVLLVAVAMVFHGLRYFALALGLVLLIVDLIRHTSPVKHKVTLILLDLAVVLWALSMYWLFIPVEHLRFQVMEPQYSSAIEDILPELNEEGDVRWSSYKLDKFTPLSLKNKVEFCRFKDSTVVYFPTFVSSFTSAGFIYFSDETARELVLTPSKYYSGLDDSAAYDSIDDLGGNWAFIVLY